MPAKETGEKNGEKSEIVVFIVRSRDSKCAECGDDIGHHGFLRKEGERGLCLDCADLALISCADRAGPFLA